MSKLTIDQLGELKGKRVLVRVDFNVPMADGKVTNDLRVRAAVPTIKKIVGDGGRCILMSHLGRPAGTGVEAEYSLRPVVDTLRAALGGDAAPSVAFADDCLDARAAVDALKDGDVLLLENLRFHAGEGAKSEDERTAMARTLAAYADLYVSDAFGTAHRDAASMTGVPRVMGQGAAGYLLAREIEYFERALNSPERPVLAILGGAKVSDKIQVIKCMIDRVDRIVIGGAMAYTFLRAQGRTTGSSKVETETETKSGKLDLLALAVELLDAAKAKNVELLLPCDHVCNDKFANTDSPTVTADANIPDGLMALDIGPRTTDAYVAAVRASKTVIWNGPMGVFEMPAYSSGTFTVARALADHQCVSIVGGGDSAAAAEQAGVAERLSHISTGGGASLELLEGKQLPGITVLSPAKKSA